MVGLLYAVNTLGAVLGALLTTFFALEALGIRKTIWIAALLNLLVVLAARSLARSWPPARGRRRRRSPRRSGGGAHGGRGGGAGRAGWLVPVAAALVGFAFLLMELVWYRMLGPLLGGSSYTFGLILAVALLGIGLGGLLYGAGEGRRRPTLLAFAATCALEALLIALPFALGDRLAVLAALLRPLGGAGFLALVGVWTAVTALVVLPAAIVAGYQFPLLIALLGSGRRRVGREVGVTYAANTLGAIVGSIAGGFGLIPLLTAPGVWRLVALLLLALAAAADRLPACAAARRAAAASRCPWRRASWGSSSAWLPGPRPSGATRRSAPAGADGSTGTGRTTSASGIQEMRRRDRLGGGRRREQRRARPVGRVRLHRQRQVRRQRARRRADPGDERPRRRPRAPQPAARAGHRPGHGQHGRLARPGAVDGAGGRRRARAGHPSTSPASCSPVNQRRALATPRCT